ncbi:MAG: Rid family hydrolase [Burkholderiales bacterium]|nr:Rid family hydrolase [Burkholderiales bacterium]
MSWRIEHRQAYLAGRKLVYPDVPAEYAGFAESVSVGNLVLLSGCTGQDDTTSGPPPAAIADQVRIALDKVRRAMENAGGTMNGIVKTFFFATSLADYPQVRKTETEFYLEHAPALVKTPPAATFIVVESLAKPEYLIEYEALGVLDRAAADWRVTYHPEFWGGTELAYPHVPKEHAKFARTQVVGNLVIVSGCQALDHDSVRVETDDLYEQSEIVLDKLKIGMEEAGGSLGNLVKTNVLIDDLASLGPYREVEREYFLRHAPALLDAPPASTVFVAKSLPRPEFKIEVEAYGVVDRAAPGARAEYYAGGADAPAAVAVGKLLFVSGCDGSDPHSGRYASGNVEAQLAAAFDKLRAAIERAGGTMNGIVKTVLMLRRAEDYPAMRRAELAYHHKHATALVARPPACTYLQMPSLADPDALFQVDAVAVR